MFYKILDLIDKIATKNKIINGASWDSLSHSNAVNLYAGRLTRDQPQFHTHFGLTPFAPSTKNICHDITQVFPLPENSVDKFQSCDVFEHIEYHKIPSVIDEIFRILKPGGLFRLSVPDYRHPLYQSRTVKNGDGNFIFDPGGGGSYVDGRVIGGGHLWFPDFEKVSSLFRNSNFTECGQVKYLHYNKKNGICVMKPIDYSLGYISRTPDFDARAGCPAQPISIVVDAYKGK